MGRIINNKLAVGFGLISYSLYLVHWPIISFYKYVSSGSLSMNEQAALAFASIVLACLMYKFIEQPFRRPLLDKNVPLPNAKFVTCISAVSIAAILASTNMWGTNGWLWRLDSERRAVLSTINNLGQFHVNYYGGVNCKPHLFCSVNEGKSPNVFFIGDSHSQAYAYGLAKVFPETKFTHLDNRCEYSTFDYCYAGKYQESNFVERKAKDFEFLKNSTDQIIIAQNWGNKPDHFNTKTKQLIEFETLEEYVNFLAREIDKVINVLGKERILVIGQVHRFGRRSNPLSCMGYPIKIRDCKFSPGRFATKFNRLFADKMKTQGIRFLSPTDVMCENNRRCLNMSPENFPYFSDWHHLSTWGSEFVIKGFEKPLSEFIQAGNT